MEEPTDKQLRAALAHARKTFYLNLIKRHFTGTLIINEYEQGHLTGFDSEGKVVPDTHI